MYYARGVNCPGYFKMASAERNRCDSENSEEGKNGTEYGCI
jgi:hypothetical protein